MKVYSRNFPMPLGPAGFVRVNKSNLLIRLFKYAARNHTRLVFDMPYNIYLYDIHPLTGRYMSISMMRHFSTPTGPWSLPWPWFHIPEDDKHEDVAAWYWHSLFSFIFISGTWQNIYQCAVNWFINRHRVSLLFKACHRQPRRHFHDCDHSLPSQSSIGASVE